ncbi:hypothetical protein QA648_36855 (plasmid) [Rhizobium sp. CB3171]|uniref:hypothetical protein n=1 Tax=Rhizobium sp. CB3171 TaxID=3039157 RepID=UPI0024B07B80|nr:hypothetical protein [Rhizobium sp. CB3171]WFU07550.1 hypothetical protein QA648_36855 [Rhizobium sp. CB3171]
MKRANYFLEADLRKAIDAKALENGSTLSSVVSEALKTYFAAENAKRDPEGLLSLLDPPIRKTIENLNKTTDAAMIGYGHSTQLLSLLIFLKHSPMRYMYPDGNLDTQIQQILNDMVRSIVLLLKDQDEAETRESVDARAQYLEESYGRSIYAEYMDYETLLKENQTLADALASVSANVRELTTHVEPVLRSMIETADVSVPHNERPQDNAPRDVNLPKPWWPFSKR